MQSKDYAEPVSTKIPFVLGGPKIPDFMKYDP
jgi:hypothetical protein